MKALILSLILFLNLFSLEDPRVLMDSISKYSMRIGNGPNKIYVFVDPLCHYSQTFISLISKRKDLQKK